jgi:hypothetical protein
MRFLKWRPHVRARPNRAARDRLRFGFGYEKAGKRPGFTDSTGEYRDTRTGWLRERDSNLHDALGISLNWPADFGQPVSKIGRVRNVNSIKTESLPCS